MAMATKTNPDVLKDKSAKRYSAPAVEQASQILFCLAAHTAPQLSLAEIAEQVGVSLSKAFGILEALQKSGLVKRGQGGKGYALGPGLVALSRKVLDDLVPSRFAEPFLDALARETGSTTVFGLITGETVYVAAKRESDDEIRITSRLGHILPVTFGAHGKAIAAFLPEEERDRVLRRKELYFHGSPEKLDKARLTKELAECREKGFACDFGESSRGVNVIAAPVLGAKGTPVGFVEIFNLAAREKVDALGAAVVAAGRSLSQQLGAQMDWKEGFGIPITAERAK
jgi:DNA-binding IclR family transcriptional regulator